ncbi:MAG: hypothetical protein DWQ19_10475 [Crenarchaeota archaeon]|nr:MAG: hypothetical protein DWQ19_10475 [Thermoproteota archaeon]
MQIFEEYLQRHSITGVPLLRHTKSGYLFLRENKPKWKVLSIFWKEPTYRPGYYVVNVCTPRHNSNAFDMEPILPEVKLGWDDYEEFLLNWATEYKDGAVVADKLEVLLMSWEMFVFSHDAMLARSYPSLIGSIYETLDFTQPKTDRFQSYNNLAKQLDPGGGPFPTWFRSFEMYNKHYCYWLSELVKANG